MGTEAKEEAEPKVRREELAKVAQICGEELIAEEVQQRLIVRHPMGHGLSVYGEFNTRHG